MWWAGSSRTLPGMPGFPRSQAANGAGCNLAALLIDEWDVIALDEPTNHLDIQGITWLAAHVKERWRAGPAGCCW